MVALQVENYLMEFENRVVLVTGGNTGVGRAISKGLCKKGATVYVNYIENEEDLNSLKDETKDFKGEVIGIKADISRELSCETIFEQIIYEKNRIDILINNAGILIKRMLFTLTEKQWKRTISINLSGTYYCCRLAMKYMENLGFGRIVNIGSILAIKGMAGTTSYSTSKAGILGLSKALVKEISKKNITINTLALGAIEDTGMVKDIKRKFNLKAMDKIFSNNLCTSEEVVSFVLFLCSEKNKNTTGQVFLIGRGLNN